jgi:hypothetical protein
MSFRFVTNSLLPLDVVAGQEKKHLKNKQQEACPCPRQGRAMELLRLSTSYCLLACSTKLL